MEEEERVLSPLRLESEGREGEEDSSSESELVEEETVDERWSSKA